MGFDDRDYQRPHYGDYGGYGDPGSYGRPPGIQLRMPQTMTVRIILLTFIVYLLQYLINPLTDALSLHENWYTQPWRIIGFVTYGFLHSQQVISHILFNMLVLWFFGRPIEDRYGPREFLAIYLVGIVFSAIVWNVTELMAANPVVMALDGPREQLPTLVGASGGLATILMLFVLLYPHVKVYVYFLFPVPAWVLGVIWFGGDAIAAITRSDSNVAYTAHLGGALLGFLYYKWGGRLTSFLPGEFKMPSFKRQPNLRVHRPSDEHRADALQEEVDRILKKISESGQESLSARERKTLEKASNLYKQGRQ